MTHNISDHGTAQRADGRPVRRQLQGTRQSVFKRLMMGVTTCAIALAAFVVVDASSGRASDVEGIYDLSTTNASGNVDPIGAVNSFRVFMKPTTTSTQFKVSFDTGTVSYSLNGSSGSLTSGVPSDPLAVPIGESDLVLTYTNSLSEQSVYHVFIKRHIEITDMWFEGTTVSSPTNFDSSTTVTVPLTPVWNANADGLSPGFTVSVPHGVVKGRLVWTYSRVGQQSVTGYSVSYDANGINSTDYGYDSNTLTGKATSGWGGLGVGSNRFKVNSGTVISSGDANLSYAVYITRGTALSSDAVSALALNDTNASLQATGATYTWQTYPALPPTASTTHVNATFATGSASWSMNGESGNLTSGVDSGAISVPIGESDLSVTYTPVSGSPIVYHVFIKRHIEITDMWFEGTTVSSPTNFDSSTTVTVPLTPVWNANADGLSPGFTVSVPHGVVKGRLVWTYSRVGQQSVTGYSVSYDANGINSTDYGYDSNTLTGKATSGWGGLGVGSNRFKVNSGTVISSGDANLSYAVYITRRAATVVPGPPLVRAAEPADATSALVSWDPPITDGGETIDSYTVTSNQVIAQASVFSRSADRSTQSIFVADVADGTCLSTTTSCLVTGLTTGATYTFSVMAKNINGNGPNSVATSAVTILVAPNAPTAVTAVAGVNSASVSWTAPVVDGGSAITGYRVTSSLDGLTCQPQSVVTLSCDVTGLTSGTNYTFTAIAINAIGNSVASTVSNSVSPTAPATTTTVPASTTTVPAVTTTVPAATTTVPAATTTVPASTTTVPASTTTVPASTTTVPAVTTTVPAPAESVVLELPRSPQPLLEDTALVVGEQVLLEYDGFVPGEFVQLIVASTPQVIASGYADSLGRIRLTGTLPSGLESGQHNVALYAPVSGHGVRQPITVEQIQLPATGMGNDLTAQLLLAVLVTMFGLLQFVSKKRRVISR
jgi:hypothetical protein